MYILCMYKVSHTLDSLSNSSKLIKDNYLYNIYFYTFGS